MKTLHDFAFCDGTLTPGVVFYLVTVGVSERDQQAKASIQRRVAGDCRYFFCVHTKETANFITRVEQSLFASAMYGRDHVHSYLRRKVVTITWLAAFLRSCPPMLLNSERINTTFNQRLFFGTSIVRPAGAGKWTCLSPTRK